MISFLRKGAARLNLFYNFKLNSEFPTFEVVYTYIYVCLFIGICSFLGYLFFKSTHMSFKCETAPNKRLICINDFVACACQGENNIINICKTDTASDLCVCCSYGQIVYQSGILLFLTHVGGLYTFTIGISLVLVGMIRNYMFSRKKTPEIVISELQNN
jgi:hypothetical protein